ncbi:MULTISPECIES: TIGR02281 family clan AA aspartic protease [unclassified Beijerinckia]|uniref:retropepsin-like aspartic protease family protein n=1 Tax=unclassified Beijerinckia TaxID=2638183 RepID=UPI00089705D0|nr:MULTISPECIES: TIGR02281 family clan AA aspartic protease [unclassified Beijerinckia]MDH7796278.1 aspartyl protease family protein [Beijerinckia sp. GAS462]SEC38160.1 aspartyl protease family protein [Beijerinckia sp. 28-YEA-48]
MKFVFVILAVAAAFAIGGTMIDTKIFGLSPGAFAAVLAFSLIAVANIGWYVSEHRGRLSTTLLQAVAWVVIFGVVITGYAFRQEFAGISSQVMDELVPGRTPKAGPGEAIAVRRSDGHFGFDAIANGTKVTMMFDTGASSVVLTAQDAQRMGVDLSSLDYTVRVSTANGTAMAAPYYLDALTIGNITVRRVRALVARPGALSESLLGQSFLEKLAGYNVEKNRLVLRGI